MYLWGKELEKSMLGYSFLLYMYADQQTQRHTL